MASYRLRGATLSLNAQEPHRHRIRDARLRRASSGRSPRESVRRVLDGDGSPVGARTRVTPGSARRLDARGRGLALRPRHGHALLAGLRARARAWIPRREVRGYADLDRFGSFQDEWLRGGPVRRWVPKGYADRRSPSSRPAAARACRSRASTSTTSASTTRRSATRCPTRPSRKGADWLPVGPSGPRRLRLAVEHLCQHRGGICFMVDLDPRWVIKLIKAGEMARRSATSST